MSGRKRAWKKSAFSEIRNKTLAAEADDETKETTKQGSSNEKSSKSLILQRARENSVFSQTPQKSVSVEVCEIDGESPEKSTNPQRAWKKSAFSQTLNKSVVVDADDATTEKTSRENFESKLTKKKKTLLTTSNWNWTEVFEPKTPEELALHPKKFAELNQWFSDCNDALSAHHSRKRTNSKIARICLITGPSGAGKTAAVRALAKKYQFQLQEWINPLDQESIQTLGDQESGEGYIVSHLSNFKSFLFHASRYKSLLDSFDKRLLLVEDFPNALLNDSKPFEEILSEYIDYGRSPLIFVVSDSKTRGLNISYNLFPDETKQKFDIAHISFNPIANTLMLKAIKRFNELIKMVETDVTNYKIPTQNVIDSICLSAQGDIRNAMINYHFAALIGAPDILLNEKTTQTGKGKTRTKKQTTFKSVGRDESVTLLHAIGRVLNPKFSDEHTFVNSPEQIAEAFSTEPKRFLDFVHANSLKHFSDIEHVVLAADSISIADLMLQEYRSHAVSTIGLNIAVRGTMVANLKPVHGWMPVCGPKRLNIEKSTSIIPANIYATDYANIMRIINPSKQK